MITAAVMKELNKLWKVHKNTKLNLFKILATAFIQVVASRHSEEITERVQF